MAHSQIPNTFQSRPSYRQVLHKPFIQPQDDHLMQQFQTNFNTLLNQPKSPVQISEPFQLQLKEDEQTHQNIQSFQIKPPELIPPLVKSTLNMHIDPEFIIIKKQNKRKPKQIQPSTQKFVKAPNHISAGFKYQRQKVQPTMDESFHTGYAAETQQQPIVIPQSSLFDQLLKMAPPPQQVQFIKQLDTMGPFEYCLGSVDGEEVHYVRQQCIQDAPIYSQFGIQLEYPM